MAVGESSLTQGALRSTSEAPPAHYILSIQQFSALTKHNIQRYETNEFEAGGYKWKLVIHPNGNKSKNAGEFLSVYLAMADTSSLAPGWEVYATFSIFLHDQNNDNYLKVEDERTNGRRFHQLRTEWGFDKFISLKAFGDSNNSYLLGDSCALGAEVFVCKERSKGKTESLSMVKDVVSYKHTWKISSYSKVNADCESSNIFKVGDHKWWSLRDYEKRLMKTRFELKNLLEKNQMLTTAPPLEDYKKVLLYPNGKDGTGGHISLKLALAEPQNLPFGTKILAEFTIRMLHQLGTGHYYGKASYWFSASKPEWGWQRFISHDAFFNTNRGLLLKDVCCIEAEVAINAETTVSG